MCEKRRNCLLQAISPFLTMYSTAIEHQNAVLWGNRLSPWYHKNLVRALTWFVQQYSDKKTAHPIKFNPFPHNDSF